MSLHRQLKHGLRALFRKETASRELDDEVRHYLDMATQQHMRAGMSRADAERAARVDFGGVEAVKEEVREGGWESGVDALAQDARYAIRGLRRSPAFAAVAVATLALGIGATTAMFSVVNAVLLRPLPYRNANELALIWTDDARRGLHQEPTAYSTITDWRRDNRSFQEIAFYSRGRITLAPDDDSRERTIGSFVSGNLFSTLGVAPVLGRPLTIVDEYGTAPVAVISHSLWQRRFGGAMDVVGKTIIVDDVGKNGGGALTIIGVMPPRFFFPDKSTELWTPATRYWRWTRETSMRVEPSGRRWIGVARLKPDASMTEARGDMAAIGRRLAVAYPTNYPDFPGFETNVVPILDSIAGSNLQQALWLLLGAVGLVLLMACANVANLLLARGAARQQELAVRRALGAGRSRLVRQLLVESVILALVGGGAGVLLAMLGTGSLGSFAANRLPRIDELSLDGRVLAFAAFASIVSGLLFGIVPAIRMSGSDATAALKEGSSTGGGIRVRRTRGLLILAESGLAVVLLTGAGLLLRSLERLRSVDPGFDASQVLAVRVEFPRAAPPTPAERGARNDAETARARASAQLGEELVARLAALPGVQSVGFTDDMFIGGQPNESIMIPGREEASLASGQLNSALVSPTFFETMRVPVVRGRNLTSEDTYTRIRALWTQLPANLPLAEKERLAVPEPVVVNQAFVRRFFPTEDPIGKRFCIDPTNKTYWYEIVGVVGDMHRQGLDRQAIPEYFGPYFPSPSGRADLLIRTEADPLAMAGMVRQVIMSTVSHALIPYVSTADRQLGDQRAERSFQTWLLTLFAALALGLAAVGIYGVVHYAVAERTREIGVRIALGATAGDVIALVIRQGMRLPLAGMLVGVVGAFAGTRIMSHLLFGVGATDPATFAGVIVVLAAVALGACLIPARRAAHLDPVTALRRE